MRRIFLLLPVLIIIIGTVLAGSFWLVPRDRLNELIANQLTDAFGYRVTVSGRPSVGLFPYLGVSFGPLTIAANINEGSPLMEIERASGRLSVTSLWEGKPALRFINLEKARIVLSRDSAGDSNWTAARFFANSEEGPSNAPELRFPKHLRTISLTDSTLTVMDPGLEGPVTLTAVNATIVGPPRSVDFRIDGSFIWRNEVVSASANLSRPGIFMTGGVSSAILKIASNPVNATFKGDLVWTEELRGDGSLEALIGSGANLAEWLDLEGGAVLPAGELRFLGDGVFTRKKLAFRPIGIRFADGKADGRLELDLAGPGLGISGTLAFDRMVVNETDRSQEGDKSLFESILATGQSGVKLDLRLSADTARIAGQEVQNMAVGVILQGPSFLVNIGSAKLSGNDDSGGVAGNLGGEIAVQFDDHEQKASANLTLGNVTFDALERLFGTKLPFEGHISLSLQAEAAGVDLQAMEDTLEMSIVADIRNGSMDAIRLQALMEDDDRINGDDLSTQFARGKIVGIIRPNGIIDVSELLLNSDEMIARASGKVDVISDKLSMLGSVKRPPVKSDNIEKEVREITFTLGGAISRPKISSVNGVIVQTQDSTQ